MGQVLFLYSWTLIKVIQLPDRGNEFVSFNRDGYCICRILFLLPIFNYTKIIIDSKTGP